MEMLAQPLDFSCNKLQIPLILHSTDDIYPHVSSSARVLKVAGKGREVGLRPGTLEWGRAQAQVGIH